MNIYQNYETIIGLEVHAQLLTKSKAYSNDSNAFGHAPNENISCVTLGLPGTLPVVNQVTIDYAIKLGLALDCKIREVNEFARKNYFYADLPKGYQITQDKTPICTDGKIRFTVKNEDGTSYDKTVGITRIHMEEDAGKLIHDLDPFFTLIDLNRAGVPLLEIVSEPDLRTAQEAYQYLTEIRKIVRFLDVCDGNMEEGSLRCDVNVSVKLKSETQWGTRIEVKNMNSIRNVKRAIEHETKRQIDFIESGGIITQETRNFDAIAGTTSALRAKESANDYRYFPEPDMPPVIVSAAYVEEIKNTMPMLPKQLSIKYQNEFGLSAYDAQLLSDDKDFAAYFDCLILEKSNAKAAANFMIGPIKNHLNQSGSTILDFPISPIRIAQLLQLVENKKISQTAAQSILFEELLLQDIDPLDIAIRKNILMLNDDTALNEIVKATLVALPDKVLEYKNGKKGLIGLFVGDVMKRSEGKADPQKVNALLVSALA